MFHVKCLIVCPKTLQFTLTATVIIFSLLSLNCGVLHQMELFFRLPYFITVTMIQWHVPEPVIDWPVITGLSKNDFQRVC